MKSDTRRNLAPPATFFERPGGHRRVAAAWCHDATATTTSLIAADGCFDVILAIDAEGRPTATLYTPVRAAHSVVSQAGTTTLGVRVLPGHGGALALAVPELLRIVEREIDGGALDRLEAIVAEALLGPEPPASVTELVAAARATAGGLRLGGASSGAASRELQRACRRWVGLPPKAFLRIERAWAARRAILAGQPFADVAAELGYADQAHLTREVRALLGRTPRELSLVANLQDAPPPNR